MEEDNRSDLSKHTTLFAILGLGLMLLLGTVGFHQYYSTRDAVYSWFDCFYLSLQLIPMNSGGVSSPIPLLLNIARFTLPMLAAYVGFSLILFAFRYGILSFQLRKVCGDHVIICGLGRKGNFLARAYYQKNQKVVLIEKDPHNKHLEAYRQNFKSAPVLIADACDPTTLKRARISKAKLLISTLGQDTDNACVATAAKKALEQFGTRYCKDFECKINVSNYNMWTLFHETEFDRRHDAGKGSEIFRLSFFNVRESGARYVVHELLGKKYFNPEACDEPNRIGIIDLSGLGELLILHIAREWSETFRNQGKRIKLFLWDTDIEQKIKMIHNKYPIVKDMCEILTFNLDVVNPFFAPITLPECFDGGAVLPIPIYVCLEDQNVCVNLSMAAMRAYRTLPVRIVVLLSEDKGLLDPLNNFRGQNGTAKLQAINLLEKICNPDVLDDGTHEALARVIHEAYLVDNWKDVISQPWEDLSPDEKSQNLDQARAIGDQLHSVGCGITPWIEYGAESFHFTEHEVESMAMAEHERWMSKYKGWKYGPLKNKEKKEHPCLVPWITLPKEERDKDRNTVRQIPMYLAKAGFQIYRMRITEV